MTQNSLQELQHPWKTEIQELDGGNGATTTDYLISRAFVEQLDKSDAVLKIRIL